MKFPSVSFWVYLLVLLLGVFKRRDSIEMDINGIIGETKRSVNFPTKSAIYVWGYNQSGQTGREGKDGHLRIPKQLPPELFGCPAGANARWLDIACGREHTAAVASDGSLFTWGLFPSNCFLVLFILLSIL